MHVQVEYEYRSQTVLWVCIPVQHLSSLSLGTFQLAGTLLSFLQPETAQIYDCAPSKVKWQEEREREHEHKSNHVRLCPFGAVTSPNGPEFPFPQRFDSCSFLLLDTLYCCYPCCRIAWGPMRERMEKREWKLPEREE